MAGAEEVEEVVAVAEDLAAEDLEVGEVVAVGQEVDLAERREEGALAAEAEEAPEAAAPEARGAVEAERVEEARQEALQARDKAQARLAAHRRHPGTNYTSNCISATLTNASNLAASALFDHRTDPVASLAVALQPHTDPAHAHPKGSSRCYLWVGQSEQQPYSLVSGSTEPTNTTTITHIGSAMSRRMRIRQSQLPVCASNTEPAVATTTTILPSWAALWAMAITQG